MSEKLYTESDYNNDVRDYALDYMLMTVFGCHPDYGTVPHPGDVLDEMVDGSQWIIYYNLARKVLEYSVNEDAFFDAGVGLDGIESMGQMNCVAAYYALRADIYDKARELQGDVEDDLGMAFDELSIDIVSSEHGKSCVASWEPRFQCVKVSFSSPLLNDFLQGMEELAYHDDYKHLEAILDLLESIGSEGSVDIGPDVEIYADAEIFFKNLDDYESRTIKLTSLNLSDALDHLKAQLNGLGMID